ncbi:MULTISPECIES: 2Fe-2S iron-sulfur cluster binding domain-containing protein [Oxalobacteraceae]|uniref:2Fe-2S iron-sulfur cluster binding domain-containing protein n=1 Tax=Oxalobacteraceae TaxID=75682 RepID=UPI0010A48927|nr:MULTISPECIES: 2Fe-2S iron-sulfur cluster binding domain-containing protein [Oxalobacteraceae]HJV80219.1 2Fe-2S iron-sulfur cluster binding domain-containing protein [Noviherbaspirillum sp.]
MAHFTITIEDTGETFRCSDRQSLLVGMEALGKKGIPVGCRGGGCGVCKIEVTAGDYRKRAMSREHVSEEDEAEGRLLACRVTPVSDVTLKVVGKMKKNVCREQASES